MYASECTSLKQFEHFNLRETIFDLASRIAVRLVKLMRLNYALSTRDLRLGCADVEKSESASIQLLATHANGLSLSETLNNLERRLFHPIVA